MPRTHRRSKCCPGLFIQREGLQLAHELVSKRIAKYKLYIFIYVIQRTTFFGIYVLSMWTFSC